MKMSGRTAWPPKRIKNKYDHHSTLTGRTSETLAEAEVHGLHALGEHDLVDST